MRLLTRSLPSATPFSSLLPGGGSFVIIVAEGLVFALPFSPMAYLPRCFFGCLLLLIAIDLCAEWLWGARSVPV